MASTSVECDPPAMLRAGGLTLLFAVTACGARTGIDEGPFDAAPELPLPDDATAAADSYIDPIDTLCADSGAPMACSRCLRGEYVEAGPGALPRSPLDPSDPLSTCAYVPELKSNCCYGQYMALCEWSLRGPIIDLAVDAAACLK